MVRLLGLEKTLLFVNGEILRHKSQASLLLWDVKGQYYKTFLDPHFCFVQ
jgi:hypothetical protein